MNELFRQAIPLALSINTLTLMWLAGNKKVLSWWLAIVGQAGWAAFIVMFEAWGLAPMCVGLTIVYVRNLIKWRRERTLEMEVQHD